MAYMRFTIHSMPELTPVGAAAVEENRGPPLVLLCPPSELAPHSLFSSLGAKLSSGAGCCPEADASCSRFSRSMMCCLVSWKERTKPTHSTTVQVAAYIGGRLRIGYSCRLHDISSYTLSTYALPTVAISTAPNFNLLHFQPSAIST